MRKEIVLSKKGTLLANDRILISGFQFLLLNLLLSSVLFFFPEQLLAGRLPEDARLFKGRLDNGVTWIYRHSANPPGKMALMVDVATGSLNETDTQKGLAHFLEHMCFNGTEHFPPGKLISYFESIGMQFGADLNAFTSFDHTAYMLFTPDTKLDGLDKALMVLSDYVFRASLLENEINKERGIILEEARSGKSAEQRIRDKLWPDLFEGSRFALRIPIGDEKIIAHAPRKEFLDYYRQWYRPENTTIFLVGDTQIDGVIPLIKKWFGDHKASEEARKPFGPEFKPFSKERVMVVTDPELASAEIEIVDLYPGRPPTITTEQWRTELLESIGSWILARRYDELIKKNKASFRQAEGQVSNFFHDGLVISQSAEGEPVDWAVMLRELITELKRVRDYGFTDHELMLAKKEILASSQHALETESTQNARDILMGIMQTVSDQRPVLSAQQKLDLCKEFLPTIELAEINKVFKNYFASQHFAYIVTMPQKDGIHIPQNEEVLAIVRESWKQEVAKIQEEKSPAQLLSKLPVSGKTIASNRDTELEITSASLENGVLIHHRFMDYKKDSVFMSISLAGGDIEETPQNKGITGVSTLAINNAATQSLSSTVMRDLLTGKQIDVQAAGDGDALTIQITGSSNDLEIALQKVYLLLTEGKIEESAFKNWRLGTLQQIEEWEKSPSMQAGIALGDLLSGDDPRRKVINRSEVESQSIAPAQKWFDRLCRTAPMEVAIIGDISWEKAKALAEQYLGALSKREKVNESFNQLRLIKRSVGPFKRDLKVKTITPKAIVLAGFIGSEGKNIFDSRALQVASVIMTSRLIAKIREELSLVYSIGASSSPSWIYKEDGRWSVSAPCDPVHVEKVSVEITKMLQQFSDNGPTDEELINAKKQIAHHLDIGMREPGYWWNFLKHFNLRDHSFDEEKTKKRDYENFTCQQIKEVFKKYYLPERSFLVTAIPVDAKSEQNPDIRSQNADH